MPSREAKSDYFSHRVAARLDGPVLRYSNRVALLKEAEKLGIGRFEANLLIAKVQHAKGQALQATTDAAPGRTSFVSSAAMFVVVQSAILGAAWWILH